MAGSSLYSPVVNPKTDFGAPQKIYYVDAFPGAGKTYTALQLMGKHIKKKSPCVMVYAAPTVNLLDQTLDDLLTIDPKFAAKIRVVRSASDSSEIEATLKNGLLVRKLASKIISGTVVRRQFEAHLAGSTELRVEAIPDGSVIFTTHSCIASLPLNLKGRKRVSLVFDEARQCLDLSTKLKLPTKLMKHFLKSDDPYILRRDRAGQDYSIWSWNPAKKPLKETEVRSLWESMGRSPTSRPLLKFIDFLNATRNTSLDVWVRNVEDGDTMTVDILKNPSRMFYGFGKVLILAAFFKASQMGRLLAYKESNGRYTKGKNKGIYNASIHTWDQVDLVDVTTQMICPERLARAKERVSNVQLTYIFDLMHDGKPLSLSKSLQRDGIVVPMGKYDRFLGEYSEATAGAAAPSLRASMASGNELASMIRKKIKGVSELSPVQYMATKSCELYEKWNQSRRCKHPLLITLNSSLTLGDRVSGTFRKEDLDVMLGSRVTHITPMSQGLNVYKEYRGAAFLAAMKLTPQQAALFDEIIPEYDSSLDRTLDLCIQFLMRSNVRDSGSDKSCLFIVSDRTLAVRAIRCLDSKVKLVPPEKILPDLKPHTILKFHEKEDAEVRRQKNKAYHSSERGKRAAARAKAKHAKNNPRYYALTTQISRTRKKMECASKGEVTQLEKKLAQLMAERASLKKEGTQ